MNIFKKINYIISTGNQKIYSISTDTNPNHIYFSDDDNLQRLSSNTTIDCALGFELRSKRSTHDIQLIHNLYDSNNVYYKSALYSLSKLNHTNTSKDFQNITDNFNMGDFIAGTQVDNNAYMLKSKSPYGRYHFDVYQYLSENNGQISIDYDTNISTIIYDYETLSELLYNNQRLSEEMISSVILSVNYNKLYEMPGNINNDYQSSNIAATTLKTKNQYNSEYNMSSDTNHVLAHCRDYIDVNSCNNQLYLKYYDNVNYEKDNKASTVPNTKNIIVSQSTTNQNQLYNFTYQHVEVVKNINRLKNLNSHKSNLFSISINTNLLDELQEKMKANVISEIKNITRDIVENIAPINTQLFNVYINGK